MLGTVVQGYKEQQSKVGLHPSLTMIAMIGMYQRLSVGGNTTSQNNSLRLIYLMSAMYYDIQAIGTLVWGIQVLRTIVRGGIRTCIWGQNCCLKGGGGGGGGTSAPNNSLLMIF